MVEIGLFLGLLVAAAIGLVVILLRRRNSATANVDGLLVEQARRLDRKSVV